MIPSFIPIRAICVGTFVALSLCTSEPLIAQHEESSASDQLDRRSLRSVMVGLAQDMNRMSDGIWREDYEMIRDGAHGVAHHPKPAPEEVTTIKETLGERFEVFVSFDKLVHGTAVEIAEAAAERHMDQVLRKLPVLQQGCVSCHATFRDEVRKTLYK